MKLNLDKDAAFSMAMQIIRIIRRRHNKSINLTIDELYNIVLEKEKMHCAILQRLAHKAFPDDDITQSTKQILFEAMQKYKISNGKKK